MADLDTKKGTIAHIFAEHRDEIFALCKNYAQFDELKKKVNELLDNKELSKNPAVAKAKQVLDSCANHYNLYISTLITYMTGIKGAGTYKYFH